VTNAKNTELQAKEFLPGKGAKDHKEGFPSLDTGIRCLFRCETSGLNDLGRSISIQPIWIGIEEVWAENKTAGAK
jgi:hypothetical protein